MDEKFQAAKTTAKVEVALTAKAQPSAKFTANRTRQQQHVVGLQSEINTKDFAGTSQSALLPHICLFLPQRTRNKSRKAAALYFQDFCNNSTKKQ